MTEQLSLNLPAVWQLFEMARSLPMPYEPARPADDAVCADAVTAFCGNINTVYKHDTLLGVVVERNAPYTLAALGARGDVDPYHVRFGVGGHDDGRTYTAMDVMLYWQQSHFRAFLDAFPAFDVNVSCNGDATTPLEMVLFNLWPFSPARVHMLLDAGADCSKEMFDAFRALQADKLAYSPHVAWLGGERRVWMIACVALAVGAAECCAAVSVPAVLLADTLRVCMPPQATGQPSHQLASEYANMVATFL